MSLDASTVAVLVAVPAGVTALATAVGKYAETRGERSKLRLEEEKRRSEEDGKDHDRLRQERDEAWDDLKECRKDLAECQQTRVSEIEKYGAIKREFQEFRHDWKSIMRAALMLAKDSGGDPSELEERAKHLEASVKP